MNIKNKKYKALMLDLDGTTVPNRRDGMPSERVIKAIEKASKVIKVSLATGRPYSDCKHILDRLKLSGPSIMAGGAEVRNSKNREILWSKTISDNTTNKILKLVEQNNMELVVVDNGYYKASKLFNENYLPVKPLLLSIPNLSETFSDQIINKIDHIPEIAIHKVIGWNYENYWLQITHAEATKQHGIFEVAKLLGIDTHEIIGIGDSYNDFPLLMACGLKIAMGNAAEDLKAIADYVAPTVEDDGVADVIEKFVL